MAAIKYELYRAYAIWTTADNGGFYFEITDLQGKDVYTTPDSYDSIAAAIKAAQGWIDSTIYRGSK